MRRLCLSLLILAFAAPLAAQEDAAPAAWPIIERCIDAPTPPPADWSFEGAILMTGPYGLHAYEAGAPTPRVVAFIDTEFWSSEGVLSPDGHWYAVPRIESFIRAGTSAFRDVTALEVYSTADSAVVYIVDWQYSEWIGTWTRWTKLSWYDHEQLVYPFGEEARRQDYVINPFTGERTSWRAVNEDNALNSTRTRGLQLERYENPPGWRFFDGQAWRDIAISGYRSALLPDNAGFAAVNAADNALTLFDAEGQPVEAMFTLDTGQSLQAIFASPDGRYLAFTVDQRTIYLADLDARQIIDLCLPYTYRGMAWSPDGTQIATYTDADAIPVGAHIQYPITVITDDFTRAYVVAYNAGGEIIGWRAD